MTAPISEMVARLERALPALSERRRDGNFPNDMFGAVDDLIDLGRRMVAADTRVDYPARVQQERELWNKLAAALRNQSVEEMATYKTIFEIAEQILAVADRLSLPSEGHLRFLSVVRENFRFLETEYGFAAVNQNPIKIRYSSGKVYVELTWAKTPASSCSFGPESESRTVFWIDDLLFQNGDERYKSLPDELTLDSEAAIRKWVAFLASALRRYADGVLRDRPRSFDALRVAQESRNREYTEEMERRYHDRMK